MPGKLTAAHHTVSDWDFQFGAQYRTLDDTFFISAPTSLKLGPPPGGWNNAVLCRIPATLCLPQGELRTWLRSSTGFVYPALFRNQAPLGTANFNNGYYMRIAAPNLQLTRVIGGTPSVRDSCGGTFTVNTWTHLRFFYYNGLTPGEEEALCVDAYEEIDGEWVKFPDTLYDTDNTWKDSEINRSGFFSALSEGARNWWDDTEIWGPV
jgi:hypothetical protein